jgi:hypothetical protein
MASPSSTFATLNACESGRSPAGTAMPPAVGRAGMAMTGRLGAARRSARFAVFSSF